MLLERNDVNADTPDTAYCRTPLSWAALSGCEGVVRMLLEGNDVNTNHSDKKGRTLLTLAARNKHEGVTRMLLERDNANPDTPDTEYGRIVMGTIMLDHKMGGMLNHDLIEENL